MLIKFIARGTGRARRASTYLLNEVDSAGRPRPGVEVLRGDPKLVAAAADALRFKRRYTSGVIAWAPEDRPTDAQIGRALDAFEKAAWAGLEPDRYCWSAVLHREEGGGCHAHVLAARVDLGTGKSLNIAPPGHRRLFDALRDWLNAEHGWAGPDGPERARDFQPGAGALAAVRSGGLKELAHAYLEQRIEAGAVRDRAGVVAALEEAGFQVPRRGENYLTVLDPDSGRRCRMKGRIYERDWTAEPERQAPEPHPGGPGADGPGDRAGIEEFRRELQAQVARRAAYHRERYPLPDPPPGAEPAPGLADPADRRAEPVDRDPGRELGGGELPVLEPPGPHGVGAGAAPDAFRAGERDGGNHAAPARPGSVPDPARGMEARAGADDRRRARLEAFKRLTRLINDGIGREAARRVLRAFKAIRRGAAAAVEARRALVAAGRGLERSGAILGRGVPDPQRRGAEPPMIAPAPGEGEARKPPPAPERPDATPEPDFF
ncbi:MAG: hypothetical protein OXN84_17065 [Albidovulum sp.]|nr:hypothetical protein [Albidovulum sp.]